MEVRVAVRWASVGRAPIDHDSLDGAARQRCARFVRVDDRRRFVGARLLLRDTVVELTGCAANDVELHQRCDRCGGPHGPPTISIAGRPGPEVSVAHAGDLAVVAIARARVGVDVEPAVATTDTRRWVRGEAILKATRQGLDIEQHLLDISPSTAPPKLTGWRGPGPRPVVRLHDLDPAPGYVAAVALLRRLPFRVDLRERELIVT